MADVINWLATVFGHQQNWLSGGGVGGIAVVITATLQAMDLWKMPKRLYFVVFVVFFFVGSNYVAWHEEHLASGIKDRQIEKLNGIIASQQPQFVVTADQTASQYDPKTKMTLILIGVAVLNKGADSVAINWTAHYKSPTLDMDIDVVRLVNQILLGQEAWQILFRGEEALNLKTQAEAIQRGHAAIGRIAITVPGDRMSELNKGQALITVRCQDYLNKEYTGLYSGGMPGDVQLLPGEVPVWKTHPPAR